VAERLPDPDASPDRVEILRETRTMAWAIVAFWAEDRPTREEIDGWSPTQMRRFAEAVLAGDEYGPD